MTKNISNAIEGDFLSIEQLKEAVFKSLMQQRGVLEFVVWEKDNQIFE